MSGHSKWSKIKHQKEASDAVKGKLFTKLTTAIIVAVREGGGITDPNSNFKLRLAIEKARSINMPKENIERAIEKGKGSGADEALTEVVYEAFGPGGVGIIIEAATNNKQRAVAELKNILERGGGRLATAGSVVHLFKLLGLIRVVKNGKSIDSLMEAAINSGAVDLEDVGDWIEIYSEPSQLHQVKESLETYGIVVSSFELFYRPTTTIPVTQKETAQQVLKLLSTLEEADDVQRVFANFDIPEEYLKIEA